MTDRRGSDNFVLCLHNISATIWLYLYHIRKNLCLDILLKSSEEDNGSTTRQGTVCPGIENLVCLGFNGLIPTMRLVWGNMLFPMHTSVTFAPSLMCAHFLFNLLLNWDAINFVPCQHRVYSQFQHIIYHMTCVHAYH